LPLAPRKIAPVLMLSSLVIGGRRASADAAPAIHETGVDLLTRSRIGRGRGVLAAAVLGLMAAAAAGCMDAGGSVLVQLTEARRLVGELRTQFASTVEAANRAVMADTDDASGVAAREAQQATETVEHDAQSLQRLLDALGYSNDRRLLDEFNNRFAEYRSLDATILPLAVENTNLKAQRLSFGPARESAEAFRGALEKVLRALPAADVSRGEGLVYRAIAAVREIQAIQARHIAESDEAEMRSMETEMTAADDVARRAVERLRSLAPRAAADLAAATTALDAFKATNTELIALSRRNSNVRSLALSMGRKRTLTGACDESLRALQDALMAHGFATR
jgi:hypothetical protein